MGNCCGSVNTEPSVSTPEKTQPTSDGTTSTSSPMPRARAQSQSVSSQRHHGDGRGYAPPSSRDDAFTSHHPDRQEMHLRQNLSGGMAPMERTRSKSMHATAFQGAPSPSSSRRNRTTSTAVHGSGHRRVGTQSMSGLSSATGQIRQGGRSRFPFALQSLLPNDFRYAVGRCLLRPWLLSSIVHRFRVLVVGKVRVI